MKLITKNGFIRIPDSVIAAISGYAAMNCFGVKGMTRHNVKEGMIVLPGGKQFPLGVKVKTENKKINIELHIAMEHGVNMRAAGESIMNEVKYMVERTTGICVSKVNIFVDAVVVSE